MFRVTIAQNALSGWVAAASESNGPASCGGFAPTPQQAATQAIDALLKDTAEHAERARNWAALQARIPIGERASV